METREMKRLKQKLNNTVFGTIIVIIAFFISVKIVNLPYFHVQGETITRNLAWLILPMGDEPTDRNVAWDSELPKFVKEDFSYAEAHGYDVEYEFKGNVMHMEYHEGEWELYLKTRVDYGSEWEPIKNFSMYQTKDHNIVIYGYVFFNDWFQKITLKKNECEIETITYDASLPLDEYADEKGIGAIHFGDYTMVEDSGNFLFYKDGQYVGYQSFQHGQIKTKDLYRGLILTESNTLYMMYVSKGASIPKITFVYVDTIDSLGGAGYYRENLFSVEEEIAYLALVKKNGKIYAVVPEDWNNFDGYALARVKKEPQEQKTQFNYATRLIDLEKNLKEVCFHSTSTQWYATIVFNFNGREFYNDYFFDGYDDSVILPDGVRGPFEEKSVTTFAEMWETIEKIREAYFNYYKHSGDFVPAVLFLIESIVLFII